MSAQSHGFIEKVTGVNHTSDMVFVETELERCTENSTWNQRLDFFCELASTSDFFFKKPVTCHRIILRYEYVAFERIFHNTYVYRKLENQEDAEASWDGAAHTRYWKPLSRLLSSKSLLRLWVQFDYIICSALQRLHGFR